MTDDQAASPPDTLGDDELWDHDSLVAQLTKNNDLLDKAADQARQSRRNFRQALGAHDHAVADVMRFAYETDAAVVQEFVRSQERIMHRLEHLDSQRSVKAANQVANAMVTWTKVLAASTVVLALATIALIFATLID